MVPATKHINDKTVLQKHVAEETGVKQKTTRHHSIPLRHRHPVVQKKLRLIGCLLPTKSRLNRLVNSSVNNSHFQAQSVKKLKNIKVIRQVQCTILKQDINNP